MALLKETIDYLAYNKTISGTQHFIEAVDYLIEEFPAMKMEEWKVIMTRFKAGYYGQKYERLMLPELVEAFKQHEGERSDAMQQKWKDIKSEPLEPLTDVQRDLMKRLVKDLDLPEDDTDNRGRWKFIEYPNDKPDLEG